MKEAGGELWSADAESPAAASPTWRGVENGPRVILNGFKAPCMINGVRGSKKSSEWVWGALR